MVQIPSVKVDLSVTFVADVGMCTLRSAIFHSPKCFVTCNVSHLVVLEKLIAIYLMNAEIPWFVLHRRQKQTYINSKTRELSF